MGSQLQQMSSRRSNRFQRGLNSEINVTPFVDVMLVLLVIFMVTSPMLITGVTVDLPETKANHVPGQDEPLTLTVDKHGKIYIHDSAIDIAHLVHKLKAVTGERYDTRIFVRGDKAIDYGSVMNVVGEVHNAGFRKVALVTDSSPSDHVNGTKKGR